MLELLIWSCTRVHMYDFNCVESYPLLHMVVDAFAKPVYNQECMFNAILA